LKELKKQLHQACKEFVGKRIEAAQDAIRMAQQSANEDSKSSMGDKYETGRAMAQLEIEKNTRQLLEAQKMLQLLERLPMDTESDVARNGSLVMTDKGNYFLSISAGKLMVEGQSYFAISTSSPIGGKLVGLKKTDSIVFNGQTMTVIQIV
jgi:hypothetical protein